MKRNRHCLRGGTTTQISVARSLINRGGGSGTRRHTIYNGWNAAFEFGLSVPSFPFMQYIPVIFFKASKHETTILKEREYPYAMHRHVSCTTGFASEWRLEEIHCIFVVWWKAEYPFVLRVFELAVLWQVACRAVIYGTGCQIYPGRAPTTRVAESFRMGRS